MDIVATRHVAGSVTSYLLVFVFFTLLCLVFQFFWSRRRIYAYTAKLPSLPSVPLLGNFHVFIGVDDSEGIYVEVIKILDKFIQYFKYSPVKFWMGPLPCVAVGSPEDMQIILNSPDSLEKAQEFYSCMQPMMGFPILYKPVYLWKRHRRLFHSAFSKMRCYNMVERFIEPCNEFLDDLEKLQVEGMTSESFGGIIDLALAKTVAMILIGIKSYDLNKLRRCVYIGRGLVDIEYQRMCKFWLHSDFIFKFTKNYQIEQEWIEEGDKLFDWFIESKRELRLKNQYLKSQGLEVEDESVLLIDILFEMRQRGELTEKQMRDELVLFIAASTDTTTFAIYITLLMIAMYPDVQEKVYQEIESIFQGSNRPVTANDLKKAKYLDMVNKEAMRLYSPIPIVARRATQDIKLASCTIPSGSIIFPVFHALHKNPELWPEPDKYDPERFHPDNKHHPYSYIPFSAGPRNCIGYEFATFFMKTICMMVVRKYKLVTDCTHDDIKLKLILTTKVSRAKPIQFIERYPNK